MTDKQWKARMAKIRKKQAEQKKQSTQKKPKKSYNFEWQYKTDEWQDLRERIIQRDNFRCVACGRKHEILHVHHLLYQRGCTIWQVPDFYLVTLCPGCHKKEHSRRFSIPPKHF